MKHLKRIFENTSNELPDDIQDAILGIVDELGQPNIFYRSDRKRNHYRLQWNLNFIHTINRTNNFIEEWDKVMKRFEKINAIKHDIASIEGRLSNNYKTSFQFDDEILFFEFETIGTKKSEYNFFNQIDSKKKIVYLNKDEITKFFNTDIQKLESLKINPKQDTLEITLKRKPDTNEIFEKFVELLEMEDPMMIILGRSSVFLFSAAKDVIDNVANFKFYHGYYGYHKIVLQ